MVSRRHLLRASGASFAAGIAGCLGESSPSTGTSPTSPPDDGQPTQSPTADATGTGSLAWEPAWTQTVAESNVPGFAPTTDALFALLSDEGGPSAVARVTPEEGRVEWRTQLEGEASSGAYADYRPIARDQWGMTLDAETVYSVHGRADTFDWTELHAIDRATGDARWSL